MPYAAVIELALYHREYGFYSSGGQAGRRGDFITSPEVGPLFGYVVANALDAEWDRLGQPEDFTVVDYGAGPGTLARSVASAEPRCAGVLRYIAIERSGAQRNLHPKGIVSSETLTAELVNNGLVGVIIANELLDNLAFDPVVTVGNELRYSDVVVDDYGSLSAVASPRAVEAGIFDAGVTAGVVQHAAASWLRDVSGVMVAGSILMIDYARLRSSEVEVRTFAAHGAGGDPLVGIGTKDITVDVDLEQLQARVSPASKIASQASWLKQHGLDALVDEGRELWHAGAAMGSLEALKARSRIREAEALTEENGLGGFTVAEWSIS